MAKVLLICGKICCGKSTYAKKLKEENNAVILSVDEIMLSILVSMQEKNMMNTRPIRKNIYLIKQ